MLARVLKRTHCACPQQSFCGYAKGGQQQNQMQPILMQTSLRRMHRMDGSRAKRGFAQSCWHGCLSAHIVPSRNRASVVMRKEGMSNGACKKHYISKPRRCISNFGKVYISAFPCVCMAVCLCIRTSIRPYVCVS